MLMAIRMADSTRAFRRMSSTTTFGMTRLTHRGLGLILVRTLPWISHYYLTRVENEHPVEDLLEQFALRRLPAERRMELLRHLDKCAACRAALDDEYEFIAALRVALRK